MSIALTDEDDEDDNDDPPLPSRLRHRLPCSGPLSSVVAVTLQISREEPIDQPLDFFNLLSLFDPIDITFHGTSSSSNTPEESYVYLDLGGLDFPRLQSVTFLNSGVWEHLRATIFRETAPSFIVVHDIVNRWPYVAFNHEEDSISNALDDMYGAWAGDRDIVDEASILNSRSLEKFVFRVANGEQSAQIWGLIRRTWEEREVDVERKTRWARLIEFEEVDSGNRRYLSSSE